MGEEKESVTVEDGELRYDKDEYEEDANGEKIPKLPEKGWGGHPPTFLLNKYAKSTFKIGSPVFDLIDAGGQDHCPVFVYRCMIKVAHLNKTVSVQGKHSSKKNAKNFAAKHMLELLKAEKIGEQVNETIKNELNKGNKKGIPESIFSATNLEISFGSGNSLLPQTNTNIPAKESTAKNSTTTGLPPPSSLIPSRTRSPKPKQQPTSSAPISSTPTNSAPQPVSSNSKNSPDSINGNVPKQSAKAPSQKKNKKKKGIQPDHRSFGLNSPYGSWGPTNQSVIPNQQTKHVYNYQAVNNLINPQFPPNPQNHSLGHQHGHNQSGWREPQGWKDQQPMNGNSNWQPTSGNLYVNNRPVQQPQPPVHMKRQGWAKDAANDIAKSLNLLKKDSQKPGLTVKPKENKQTKTQWSGWDDNKDWKPEEGYNAVYDLGDYEIGCEDRPDMVRPTIPMVVDDTTPNVVELVAPSADAAARLNKMKEMKKKREEDAMLMPPPTLPGNDAPAAPSTQDKIVKPKGWNKTWKPGERLNQAYEIHYTEEDIKFGFPTTAEKKKKQLSIDSIWNDELFDSEKYQAWEDEWAEFDYHKNKSEFLTQTDVSGELPVPPSNEPVGKGHDDRPPTSIPPRIDSLPTDIKASARDAWSQGFQDALKALEKEAIWKSDDRPQEKVDLPKSARIQNFVDDWIKQSLGVIGTQFLYEFYSSNGLLFGYYCAICCSDWPSTAHQETLRTHLTSHGHKLSYFRRQYFTKYKDITQWPRYGSEALRDYDLEEYLEDEVLKLNSSEFAQFKNINVNVRGVQHRQIVITQAEKLRDGFFLKTKTQRKKDKFIDWTLDEWACSGYPCDTINQSTRRSCLNCGEASPADPYFFYHIKASEEEREEKRKQEKRASKYAIKDKRRHFLELCRSGKSLTTGPILSKYIRAQDHIPTMTEEEIRFMNKEQQRIEFLEEQWKDSLNLDPDQPVPMDDALNDSIQKNMEYTEPIETLEIKDSDGEEDGELPRDEDDSDYDSEEAEKEEKLDAAYEAGKYGTEDVPLGGHNFCRDVKFLDGKKRMEEDQMRLDMEKEAEAARLAKGDGEKTKKRRRRAIQAARKKALRIERPEIRQLLARQKWIPRKSDNGWWLKDGMWLCKRCAEMNDGTHRFCIGCDMKAPVKGSVDSEFYALEGAIRKGASKTELNQRFGLYNNKIKRNRLQQGTEEEPDDVPGVPMAFQRQYNKEIGMFGSYDMVDERILADWAIEARERRKKHSAHYLSLMKEEGCMELPDSGKFRTINGTLGSRCRERIIRAQQRRAQDQLDGKNKKGYLAKWRKNYSQSGWWCDMCDYYSYFPDTSCYECQTPRPRPEELWKYAYRKDVRSEAIANIEKAIKEEEGVETNYLVGKGKYSAIEAPDVYQCHSASRRAEYYQGDQVGELATESQKIAAYNMMVCMTEGSAGSKTGLSGIHTGVGDDEDIGDAVRKEIEDEDAAAANAKNTNDNEKSDEQRKEDEERNFIEKLTSVPLLDKNNQFLSFEDKLDVYQKMFKEFAELQNEMAQLSSDSEDEELTKSKKLQEAQRRRRDDDFKAQLAFLHHEDFLNQLGQEAVPKYDETIKMEPVDEDFTPHINRFADEFDSSVPEAMIDLVSSSDSDDIDDEFYDARHKDRKEKGTYKIPHRRDDRPGRRSDPLRDMVKRTEEEINAKERTPKPKAPPGIPEVQWRGKSDLQKLKEKFRERNLEEQQARMADTSHCQRNYLAEKQIISSRNKNSSDHSGISNKDTNDGIQLIQVESITQGNLTEREILKINDKVWNVEALKHGGNRRERLYRREGLYYDHMGRRRYRQGMDPWDKSPERERDRRRSRDRDRDDDRNYADRDREHRRRRRRSSDDEREPRWGPDHPDFKKGDRLPYWYIVKHGIDDKNRRTWSHVSQNNKDDLMPIEKWGYDRKRLRKDIDDSREGKRRDHLWGSRGHDYERRREREREPSPDPDETPTQKRKRMEDEYKKGYERARREIMRRSVSVMRELGPDKSIHREYMRSDQERERHRIKADKLKKQEEKDLDERDEDMVDDIVDLLCSRKYGKEVSNYDRKPDKISADKEKRIRREERKKRKEAKREKKERKKSKKEKRDRERMEELESKMKTEISKKIDEKNQRAEKKLQKMKEKADTERKLGVKEIRREKEPSQDRDVQSKKSSDSSPDSDSSSLPTDEDDFFDIPSPAEDGEVIDDKSELTVEKFDKINREFTMKERIRQRLIERESFLPFGSVKFDTKDTSHNYQTDIQKMFVDLKAKVKEAEERAALGEDSVETDAEVEEKQKSKKFFESVTSCQDKGLVTDIETDNEYIPGKDSDSDGSGYEELEIEIQTVKPFVPDPGEFKTVTDSRTVQRIDEKDDGTLSAAETEASTSVFVEKQLKSLISDKTKQPNEEIEMNVAISDIPPAAPPSPGLFGAPAFPGPSTSAPSPPPQIVPKPKKRDKMAKQDIFGKKSDPTLSKRETSSEKSIDTNLNLAFDKKRPSYGSDNDDNASIASEYDPMAMFMKRDEINPPSDPNKKPRSRNHSIERSRKGDKLKNYWDNDDKHRFRSRRESSREKSPRRTKKQKRSREKDDYDDRKSKKEAKKAKKEYSSSKLKENEDRREKTRSKTKSPDRKRTRSGKVRKHRSPKRTDRSPKRKDCLTQRKDYKDDDEFIQQIIVTNKRPDDLKDRMLKRMREKNSSSPQLRITVERNTTKATTCKKGRNSEDEEDDPELEEAIIDANKAKKIRDKEIIENKTREMKERIQKRKRNISTPEPISSNILNSSAVERSLGHILDDSRDTADDNENDGDLSGFKYSSNFEKIKNKLLDRPIRSIVKTRSSKIDKTKEVVDVDDYDDVISIADSEISLSTTVCLDNNPVREKDKSKPVKLNFRSLAALNSAEKIRKEDAEADMVVRDMATEIEFEKSMNLRTRSKQKSKK